MTAAARARGQPVIALAAILCGWVLLRVVLFGADGAGPAEDVAARTQVAVQPRAVDSAVRQSAEVLRPADPIGARSALAVRQPGPAAIRLAGAFGNVRYAGGAAHLVTAPSAQTALQPVEQAPAPQVQVPKPGSAVIASAASQPSGRHGTGLSRWSADAWLLVRRGSSGPLANGPAPASYGASQAGAVLRYRIADAAGHRLAAYLRGNAALDRPHGPEVAAGLSARPFPRLPISVAAEVRLSDSSAGLRTRPAAFAVTQLAPLSLPLGLSAEAYAQGGYVGGKGATAFVDGQLRAERSIVRIAGAELRVGGGAWGGAQRGAARLDAGPSATIAIGIAHKASVRVALDWRMRLAGDAAPKSGPALTLSAGF